MNKSELLDIFNSLPEEEKNKVYLETERAIRTHELKGMFDVMYLVTLEEDIHKKFDSIDYENLGWINFIKLKRKLEDIRLHLEGIKYVQRKKEDETKTENYPLDRNATIRRLRSEGMTLDAIAGRYGITRARVAQIVGKEKKDTLGFSPEVYGALERGLIRQGIKEFTIKNLTLAIEEGLPVQNIGEKRIKEISYVLGREVTGTRVYDKKLIKSLLYVCDYVTILRFKRGG